MKCQIKSATHLEEFAAENFVTKTTATLIGFREFHYENIDNGEYTVTFEDGTFFKARTPINEDQLEAYFDIIEEKPKRLTDISAAFNIILNNNRGCR